MSSSESDKAAVNRIETDMPPVLDHGEMEMDEINPDKVEMLKSSAEDFANAEKEGRLVTIPLTKEQKRPILIEVDDHQADAS
jgi:hypothetical protein